MFWKKLRKAQAQEVEPDAAEVAASQSAQRRLGRLARHHDGGDAAGDADCDQSTLTEALGTCAFITLGVAMDADQSAIAQAVDDLAFAEDVDPDALEAARAELLAPRDRIAHELQWLPEATAQQQTDARRAITKGDSAALLELRVATSGLARVNLGLALLPTRARDAEFQRHLLSDLLQWEPQDTRDRIDEARLRSGATATSEEHFSAALSDWRRRVGRVVAERLGDTREGRVLLAEHIEAQRSEIRACSVPMLEAIANEYGALADARLQTMRGKIADALAELKSNPRNPAKVTTVITTLDLWSQWRVPQQKLEEARGLDDPLSAELFGEIREVAITFSNEHQLFEESLRLGRALKHAFGGVPGLKHKVEQDLPTLITNALFKRFEQLVLATYGEIRSFAAEIAGSGIGSETGGKVGKLCDVFEELAANAPTDEATFGTMRSVMIAVANKSGRLDVALEMIEYILEHGGPETVRNQLVQDMCQIQQQMKERAR